MKKKYRILPIGMATLGVATFLVLAIVRLAPSQDPPDPSPAELAQGARRELGFGLGDVLPSMGGEAIHEQMIQAAPNDEDRSRRATQQNRNVLGTR